MSDPVNHPAHYGGFSNGAEVIDITECLSFNLGNAVKYLARAGKKDPEKTIEDLEKARWYINREIERISPVPYHPEDATAAYQEIRKAAAAAYDRPIDTDIMMGKFGFTSAPAQEMPGVGHWYRTEFVRRYGDPMDDGGCHTYPTDQGIWQILHHHWRGQDFLPEEELSDRFSIRAFGWYINELERMDPTTRAFFDMSNTVHDLKDAGLV